MVSELQIVTDITMMLVVAGVCTVVLGRLKMPPIIGYLLAGFLLGPYIFTQYVIDADVLNIFASMGIVLLMFFIGIELNLRGLRKIASFALLVAAVEMSMMILIGTSLGLYFGLSTAESIFLGIAMSCASTAAVFAMMPTNRHLKEREKRTITGILVMEDIGLVIVLTMAGPLIPGGGGAIQSPLIIIVSIILFMGLSIFLGLAVIPRALDRIKSFLSDETLFLVALALAFAMALLSSFIGLSLAVGAFLMGIIVSESASASTIGAKVMPLKEFFIATFFISIGFAFNPNLFFAGIVLAIAIAAIFIVGKIISISSACYLANYNPRSSLLVGASLVAMGEFTFVVAKVALDGGLIDVELYSAIVGAAFITLIAMPFVSRGAPHLYEWSVRRMPERVRQDATKTGSDTGDTLERERIPPQVAKDLRRELLYIAVDLVMIVTVLIAVNLLSWLSGFLSEPDTAIASLIVFVVSLVLTLPLIFILVVRIKKLSLIVATMVRRQDAPNRRRSAAGRVFKDISEAFLAFLLFLIFLPFFPRVEGLSFIPLIAMVVFATLFTYLVWDAYKAAYRRISSSIARGVEDKPKP